MDHAGVAVQLDPARPVFENETAVAYQSYRTPGPDRFRFGGEARGSVEQGRTEPAQLLFSDDAGPPAGCRLLPAALAQRGRKRSAHDQQFVAASD